MPTQIGIIGKGNVGKALQSGLIKAGFETKITSQEGLTEIAANSSVLVLAVPFAAVDDVIAHLGSAADGKVVIDVTNALTPEMHLALGYSTSGAEELQKKLPNAKVVKAFNTVFAKHMESGELKGQKLSAFVAGDDEAARQEVLEMASAIGFEGVNAGPLVNARHLEVVGYFNIVLGYVLGNGAETGIKYIR